MESKDAVETIKHLRNPYTRLFDALQNNTPSLIGLILNLKNCLFTLFC